MSSKPKPSPFRVIPRSGWSARQPAAAMEAQAPPREAFVHWSDSSSTARIDTPEEAAAAVREIQNFHIDGRGWSDVAYHYLAVQLEGRGETLVFAGRSPRMVPAAQLGHNRGTLAICVVAGPLTDVTRRTLFCVEEVVRRHASVRTLGGHRDVVQTDCPGPAIYAQIPRMARAVGVKVYRPGA